MTDTTQADMKASGCVWWPGLLIWLAAAIAASLLDWSTKTTALVTLGALVRASSWWPPGSRPATSPAAASRRSR